MSGRRRKLSVLKKKAGKHTRWFVMYALPALLCMDSGVLPGYVFAVVKEKLVRGGEVYRTRSLGRRMKFFCSSSITQL